MSQSGRKIETQSEYLSELRRRLEKSATLSKDEIAEIIQDTEEHFRMGVSKGKTESSIASALGEPKILAEGYVAQNLVKDQPSKGNSLSTNSLILFRAMKAVFIIAPINFIFMFGPFCALAGLIFAGWVLAFAVGLACLWILALFLGSGGSVGLVLSAAVVFMVLFIFASSLVLGLSMVKITEWVFRAVWAWIRWNINFLMAA